MTLAEINVAREAKRTATVGVGDLDDLAGGLLGV